MNGSEYSPYKAIHQTEALKSGHPVSCHWFITHRCDHKCIRCANIQDVRLQHFNRSDEWDFDKACIVAEDMRNYGLKAIGLSGGEPLMYKRFDDLVSVLLQLGFDMGMISNGRRIPLVNADQLSLFKWIRFSIAGLSNKTYIPLHGNENNPDIWSIMSQYVPVLKENGCIVSVSFLVQPENYFEIVDFAQWAKSVGFDSCRFTSCWTPDGDPYSSDMKVTIKQYINKALSYSDETFEVFSFAERMDIKPIKKYSHCYYADLNTFLSANGNMYYCCMIQNSDFGYIGNLYKQKFSEIWEGRAEIDISQCPVCWFDKKNEFIEYLMNDNPRHINFV